MDDGCHSEDDENVDDVVGSYHSKTFKAGVRCCSKNGSTCTTTMTCGKDYLSYDNAVSHCAEQGRRICTKVELLNEICCGTGGQCDQHAVWTSTSESGTGIYFFPKV